MGGDGCLNEERKKLEAIGDGLLLAVARLYLKERHPDVPYKLYTRITSRLICNETLEVIGAGEGIRGMEEEKLSDAMEIAIANRLYIDCFAGLRAWLWQLFDKYVDVREEARKILEPTKDDKLERRVHGALKQAMHNQGGKITDARKAAQMIATNLRNV